MPTFTIDTENNITIFASLKDTEGGRRSRERQAQVTDGGEEHTVRLTLNDGERFFETERLAPQI